MKLILLTLFLFARIVFANVSDSTDENEKKAVTITEGEKNVKNSDTKKQSSQNEGEKKVTDEDGEKPVTKNEINKEIKNAIENAVKGIKDETSFIRFSIAFGYNWFSKTPMAYQSFIVKPDSTLNISDDKMKSVGIVSAMLTFRNVVKGNLLWVFSNINLHVNVPLTDISFSQDKLVGLFNKEIAIGFGISTSFRYVNELALGFLINLLPYDEPDDYVIRNKKFTSPAPYSKIDLKDIPTKKRIYYPMGLYLIYSF